jgi:hypothetical protein
MLNLFELCLDASTSFHEGLAPPRLHGISGRPVRPPRILKSHQFFQNAPHGL